MNIPLSRPDITQAERDAVNQVLLTPNLSLGPKLPEFERVFADYTGMKYAVAVNSGTSALHLCVRAMGIGAGDEVITTPFSFVASANCALFEGAKPVFVDIDPRTWNIDPAQIEAAITPRTKAILPVDVFGQVPDMDAILAIARKHHLLVLEDSCEALGATYKGRLAGTFGEAGCFGFYPNKQITTGEGGMIVTNDEALAHVCQSMRSQGRDAHGGWLAHARLGYNYRLSDINCALGIAQMGRVAEILGRRARVAEGYAQRLREERRVQLQQVPSECKMSWFVLVIRLNDDYTQEDRDRIMHTLREKGIGTNNYFPPIHLQPFYAEQFGYQRGDFPLCEALADRTLALPFHGSLTDDEIDLVCSTVRALL